MPLDDQILSDLRFNPLCSGAVSRMSRMGLFDSLDDAREFKEKYLSLLDTGAAGDGEADIFVFGVYEMTDSFREDEVNLETVTALTDTDRISKGPDAKGHSDPGELFRGLKA